MPILRLLQGLSLGPTEIENLRNAYEDALRLLRLVDRKDPITDLVAQRIIEIHQRGDCAPADIARIAVSELGRKPPSNGEASSQLRVLIVEDEYYLASDLAEAVETVGASVAGICGDLEDALKEAEFATLDAAIVDINLHDCDAFPVADRLKARDIPFLFATGYGAAVVPARFSDVILCEKPFDRFNVARQIVRLCTNRMRPAR